MWTYDEERQDDLTDLVVILALNPQQQLGLPRLGLRVLPRRVEMVGENALREVTLPNLRVHIIPAPSNEFTSKLRPNLKHMSVKFTDWLTGQTPCRSNPESS